MKRTWFDFTPIALILWLPACTPKASLADRPEKMNSVVSQASETPETKEASPMPAAITYISMSRTGCYGTCPIYTTELHSHGLARYTGEQFTEKKGVYEKRLPETEIKDLFQEFREYRIDTCQQEYPAYIQDLPGLFYTIVYGQTDTQRIRHAHLGPPFIAHLGVKVDSLVKPDFSWTKIGDSLDR